MKLSNQYKIFIAKITSEIDDKICDTWKINKQDIIDAINFKENLIKYLENELLRIDKGTYYAEEINIDMKNFLKGERYVLKNILERVRNDKDELDRIIL